MSGVGSILALRKRGGVWKADARCRETIMAKRDTKRLVRERGGLIT